MARFFISIFAFLTVEIFPQEINVATNQALSYQQRSFDSDTCCWRKLDADEKYLEAANLIVCYLKTNKPTNRHSLNWHAGQMYAMADSYSSAKKYMKKTYSIFYKWFGSEDGKTWYYYAKGTVAFINGNKKSLEHIIKIWTEKLPVDNNYKVLVKLNQDWGKSYKLAYSK